MLRRVVCTTESEMALRKSVAQGFVHFAVLVALTQCPVTDVVAANDIVCVRRRIF